MQDGLLNTSKLYEHVSIVESASKKTGAHLVEVFKSLQLRNMQLATSCLRVGKRRTKYYTSN